MGVEPHKRSQHENGDGSGDRAGTRTETGVETRRRTQDGSGDGNRGEDLYTITGWKRGRECKRGGNGDGDGDGDP